jgi:hypothetical protein
MTAIEMPGLAVYAAGGFILGLASFTALRANAGLYLAGGLWRPIGLHLARLAVLAGALILVARQGAGPLLAAAAGLLVARHLVVHRARAAP